MIFQRVENIRNDLLALLPKVDNETKIILINIFYSFLISTKNNLLIESFALEFIDIFIDSIQKQKFIYDNPNNIESIIQNVENLLSLNIFNEYHDKLFSTKNKLKFFKDLQISNIESNFNSIIGENKIYIPLIGNIYSNNLEPTITKVENIEIKIFPSKKGNSVSIIPSFIKSDIIENQVKDSLIVAKDHFNELKNKINDFDIIIYFNNGLASYDGNSLGLALTLGFIVELSNLYNLPYNISINKKTAFTGSIHKNGIINSIDNQLIKKKVEAVFFHPINNLVLPVINEDAAKEKLNELKNIYPKRNLKLIFAENINDVLERRSVISIEKQNLLQRTIKHTKQNWVTYLMSLILVLMSFIIYIRELDNNPTSFEYGLNNISFKNSSNVILFSLKANSFPKSWFSDHYLKDEIFFVDVNQDGTNEILYCFDVSSELKDSSIDRGLTLLNNKGKAIWKIKFEKFLTSDREDLGPPYYFHIYDTITFKNRLCALVSCNNGRSYPNPLFILDLNKSEIISDTLWNAGIISNIIRIKENNKDKLFIGAHNNSFEKVSLTKIDLAELKGQLICTKEYALHGIPFTKIEKSFLIPKTDYLVFNKARTSGFLPKSMSLNKSENEIEINLNEDKLSNGIAGIIYAYNINNDKFKVDIENNFRVKRDSLVAKGILKKPFTDTREYRELMRKQILGWDGEKYIPIDEYYKKRSQP